MNLAIGKVNPMLPEFLTRFFVQFVVYISLCNRFNLLNGVGNLVRKD